MLLGALGFVLWRVRRLPLTAGSRPARARVHRDRRALRGDPAGLARRRGDHEGDPARAPAPPDPRRGVCARPPRRDRGRGRTPSAADRGRHRRRGRGRRADRRLPDPAGHLARLRCPGLVLRAARARVSRSFGSARELGLQHRGRAEPDPPARLHVPQPARRRVHARRRPALPRDATAHPLDGGTRRHRVRGAAVDAHARGTARTRRRARRARDRPAEVVARRRGRGLRRRLRARARGVPVDRSVDELHRRGARDPPRPGGADRRRERGPVRPR